VTNAIQFVGPTHALQLFGVKLMGMNAESAKKLLFSVLFLVALLLISKSLQALFHLLLSGQESVRTVFWSRQIVHLVTALFLLVGLVSIWFDEPARITTALGLLTAGIAVALQRVITAFAGYFVLLRGSTFNVGDRIVMGGVRGDVIALGFINTTVMEMGQPSAVQNADPAMWVHGRQYTGRIVTITNDKIFQEPVYNYSREFPYIWEEVAVPIPYNSDRNRAEEILLAVAHEQTVRVNELSEEAICELERRYFVRRAALGPKVYYRLTDNWLEMSVRFICHDSGIRDVKDAMSRQIISRLDTARIGIASGTYDIVGLPPVHVVVDQTRSSGSPEPLGPVSDGRSRRQ
jgi:small-conductance mechanosensitive channel